MTKSVEVRCSDLGRYTNVNEIQGPAESAKANFSDVQNWHHVVFIRSLQDLKIFIDGVDVTSTSQHLSLGEFSINNGLLEIGAPNFWGDGDGWQENGRDEAKWKGLIDDVRIYNRELNPAEIKALYSGELVSMSALSLSSTPPIYDGQEISCSTTITNHADTEKTLYVSGKLINNDGTQVHYFNRTTPLTLFNGQNDTISLQTYLPTGIPSGEYRLIVGVSDIGFNYPYVSQSSLSLNIEGDDSVEIFEDGIFFKTNNDSVRLSVNYDNSSKAWSYEGADSDESEDYDSWFDAGADTDYAILRDSMPFYSHMLYAYGAYSPSYDSNNVLYMSRNLADDPLGDRIPLILVHGWQGNDGINNYIGGYTFDRMPEQYFQEFLAFYSLGESGLGTPQAQELHRRYKIYLYKYPSFEHITYNGRLLGEAIGRVPELSNYIKSGGKVVILAHSMGGLVARSFIEEHGIGVTVPWDPSGHFTGDYYFEEDRCEEDSTDCDFKGTFIPQKLGDSVVSSLITLATPHHGSPASVERWVDTAVIAGKNLNTPGAVDLMWDDFDGAIHTLLQEDADFGSIVLNDHYYEDGVKIYYWRQRATDKNEGNDNFDKIHDEKVLIFDVDSGYEETNPWLRELNEGYFNNNANNTTYLKYAGASIINSVDWIWQPHTDMRDILEPTPAKFGISFDEAAFLVGTASHYILNDSVVPTISACFDEYNTWSGSNSNNNFTQILRDQDLTSTIYNFGLTESGVCKYFHDYDHDKMRGGAGNQDYTTDINTLFSPQDYGNDWRNSATLTELLGEIGYNSDGAMDPTIAVDRLMYDPLFVRIAMDLLDQVEPVAIEAFPSQLVLAEGDSADIQIRLTSQPSSDIAVSVASVSGDMDIDVTANSTLVFTPSDWNQFKSVTLTAAEDDDVSSDTTIFEISAPSLKTVELHVTEADTDILAIHSSSLALQIPETSNGNLSVKLTQLPSQPVTIGVSTLETTNNVTYFPAILNFDSINWNIPQIITFSVREDQNDINDGYTVQIAADGLETVNVDITELDGTPTPPDYITIPSTSDDGSYWVKWGESRKPITDYELIESTSSDFSMSSLVYKGYDTSTKVTNRINNTYYYAIRACNGDLCSGYLASNGGVQVILEPELTLSRNIVSFGPVSVNDTSPPMNITLYNTGEASLEIGAFSFISGASIFSTDNNSCQNTTILPGHSCSFDVEFTPSQEGDSSGVMQITSNVLTNPTLINLYGMGCNSSDGDCDGDVDGVDIALFSIGNIAVSIDTMASSFGHQ